MAEPLRIGVFGGTFDPIHNVHLDIAHAALTHAGLDRVLFVVSASPPHKQGEFVASAEDRFDMVRAAIAGEDRFEASRIELDRDGPSYTVRTLRTLGALYPEASFSLIVGYDSLEDLPNWHHADEILRRARILAVARPGHHTAPPSLEGRYDTLPFAERPESSTDIRRMLESGVGLEGRIPPGTLALIRDRDIYGSCRS